MSRARLRRRLLALRRADKRNEALMAGGRDARLTPLGYAPFGVRMSGGRPTVLPLISGALIRLSARVPHRRQWYP